MSNSSKKNNHCFITIDLDPVYHYVRSRGWKLKNGSNYNVVYEDAICRYQKIFNNLGIKATFFVVGEDLLNSYNVGVVKELHEDQHEIANHTMNHLQSFEMLDFKKKNYQIMKSHEKIHEAVGHEPKGFRAPGWNIDQKTINILKDNNYLYDTSILPSYFNYPLKFYNKILNWNNNFPIFGKSLRIPFGKRTPYKTLDTNYLKAGDNGIWEVPVSTSPTIRLPLIGAMLFKLGITKFKKLLPKPNRMPYFNMVLHGLDLVDKNLVNDDRLMVKPGYGLTIEEKEKAITRLISFLSPHYQFSTINNFINNNFESEK